MKQVHNTTDCKCSYNCTKDLTDLLLFRSCTYDISCLKVLRCITCDCCDNTDNSSHTDCCNHSFYTSYTHCFENNGCCDQGCDSHTGYRVITASYQTNHTRRNRCKEETKYYNDQCTGKADRDLRKKPHYNCYCNHTDQYCFCGNIYLSSASAFCVFTKSLHCFYEGFDHNRKRFYKA